MPKIELIIELHSKDCKCGGFGWLGKRECFSEDVIKINWREWLLLNKPATIEVFKKRVSVKVPLSVIKIKRYASDDGEQSQIFTIINS